MARAACGDEAQYGYPRPAANPAPMVPPVPHDIVVQLSAARAVIERRLAGTLRAMHLFGSAVDGGLKPYSDIDLLVTVDAPLPDATRRALCTDLLPISAWPGASDSLRALEITVLLHGDVTPWRYPPRRELQFGEWLRNDLRAGVYEGPVEDPDLAIMLTKARQHSVCLYGPPASELFPAVPREDFTRALRDTVAQWNGPDDWKGDERHIVLALARIWYSAATGRIAPKDAAAAWALPRLPQEHRAILDHARSAYLGLAAEDTDMLARNMASYVQHLKAQIGGTQAGQRLA